VIIPILPEDSQWLHALKLGDQVHRMLGPVPMLLKVTSLTQDRITYGLWEFDRQTGAEIDDELGWGPLGTGSWVRPIPH